MPPRLLGKDFAIPSITRRMALSIDIDNADDLQQQEISEDLAMLPERQRLETYKALITFSRVGANLTLAFVKTLGHPHHLDAEATTSLIGRMLDLNRQGHLDEPTFSTYTKHLVLGFQGAASGENLLSRVIEANVERSGFLNCEGLDEAFATHLSDIRSNPSSPINSPIMRNWLRRNEWPACLAIVIESSINKGGRELESLFVEILNQPTFSRSRDARTEVFKQVLGKERLIELTHKSILQLNSNSLTFLSSALGEDQILTVEVLDQLAQNIRTTQSVPTIIVNVMENDDPRKVSAPLLHFIAREIDPAVNYVSGTPSMKWLKLTEPRRYGTSIFEALMNRLPRELEELTVHKPAGSSPAEIIDCLFKPLTFDERTKMKGSARFSRGTWIEAVLRAVDHAGLIELAPMLRDIKAETFEQIWKDLKNERDSGAVSRLYPQGRRAIVESDFCL